MNLSDEQVIHNEIINNNYDYNTYTETVDSLSNYDDPNQGSERGQDDDKEVKHIEEKEGFTLSEDTCFTSASTIAIDATDNETYIYLVQLYSEDFIIYFEEEIDLNSVGIELYEDNQKDTIFLFQDDGLICTENELDGTFFLY